MISFTTLLIILWVGVFPMVALAQKDQDEAPPTFIDQNINASDVVAGGSGSGTTGNTDFIDDVAVIASSSNATANAPAPATAPAPQQQQQSAATSPANSNNNNNNNIPVSAPTAAPVSVVGVVNLELISTNRLLGRDSLSMFLATTEAFLGRQLFSGNLTNRTDDGAEDEVVGASVPIMADPGLSLTLVRQSRSILRRRNQRQLQSQQGQGQPLYITLEVSGASSRPMEATNWSDMLKRIFIENGIEYVQDLRQASEDANDNIFAPLLTQVNVLLESTLGGAGNVVGADDEEGVSGAVDDEPTPTASPPVSAPTQDDTSSSDGDKMPTVSVDDTNEGNGVQSTNVNNDSSSPLSQTAIIGIAVGGGVGLLICLCCCMYFCGFASCCGRSDPSGNGPVSGNAADGKDVPHEDSMADKVLLQTSSSSEMDTDNRFEPDSESASEMTNDPDDLESQAMYSYNPRGDSGSIFTYNQNTIATGTQSVMGNDNMSYAFSLEAGIEPSVVGGVVPNNVHTTSMYDSGSLAPSMYGTDDESQISGIPIREIPNISASDHSQQENADISNSASPSVPADHFSATQIETTASDLQLTPSDLMMLPSNLRSDVEGDEKTEKSDQRSSSPIATDDSDFVKRKITAPSGKLGIVIDTTVDGPVVHKVNDQSKLLNKIFPGDNIIAIDDVNTRAMSAAAITSLMVKTAGQERVLTVRCKKEGAGP